MNQGCYEACDGLVCYYQSSFDVSVIVAQLSENNNILKNQIKELGVNDGRNLLHSVMRTTSKDRVPNNNSNINKSDKE